MSLKNRLDTLRRQTGATPATTPADAPAPEPTTPAEPLTNAPARTTASLADRLARLRPPERYDAGPSKPRVPLAQVVHQLGGEQLDDHLVAIERRFPLDHEHGRHRLGTLLEPLHGLTEADSADPTRMVFFDTETTGLAGGTGTAVFLLGLARIEDNQLRVRQYLATAFAGERPMLDAAADWIANGHLVSFNGKTFDAPLLATRCRMAGLPDHGAGRPHIDLLHPVRRAFGNRWPDCRLGTVERKLLGFVREDDLPGSEAPAAWLDWVHRGDPGRLGQVVEHNRLDLLSLVVLLPALAAAHRDPLASGAEPQAIARHLARIGQPETARRLLAQVEGLLDAPAQLLLARLHRAAGDWEAACAIWNRLAAEWTEARERLAKYHEHVRREPEIALQHARRLPPSPERDHRLRRLTNKLGLG